MVSVHFQGKPFNITVIQVYAPTSNAEEAEVERFCEDLQGLLELTPQKDDLFIIGHWNAKVGSQETPGVTGKFDLGWQGPLQRLNNLKICPLSYLWCCKTCTHRRQSGHSHSGQFPCRLEARSEECTALS